MACFIYVRPIEPISPYDRHQFTDLMTYLETKPRNLATARCGRQFLAELAAQAPRQASFAANLLESILDANPEETCLGDEDLLGAAWMWLKRIVETIDERSNAFYFAPNLGSVARE